MKTKNHGSGSTTPLHSNNALKGTIIIGAIFSAAGLIAAYFVQDYFSLSFFVAIIAGYCIAFVLYRNNLLLSSVLLTLTTTILAALGSAATGYLDAEITISVIPVVVFAASIYFSFRILMAFTVITVIAVNSVFLFFPAVLDGPSFETMGIVFLNGILLSAAFIGRMLFGDLERTYGKGHSRHHEESPHLSKGTILIVDDNETILRILEKDLTAEGYRILPFSSAVALSQWLEDPKESFKLLITDYFLNESDGRIVIERVRKILPSVPIILISGYPLNKLSFDSDYYSNVVFLQKPFSAQEMFATVKQMIG